jgi:hypothetical protein
MKDGFDPLTGRAYESIQATSWPSGFKAGYESFVRKVIANNPNGEFSLPKNGMSKEEFAKKYNIDVNRIQDHPIKNKVTFGEEFRADYLNQYENYYLISQKEKSEGSTATSTNQNIDLKESADNPKYTPFSEQQPQASFSQQFGASNEMPKPSFQQTPIPDFTKPGGQTPFPNEFNAKPEDKPAPSSSSYSGSESGHSHTPPFTPPKNEGEFNDFLRNNFGGEKPRQTEIPKNDVPRQTPIPDFTRPGGQTPFPDAHQMPNMHKLPEFKWQTPEDYQSTHGSSKPNSWGLGSLFEGAKNWFESASSTSGFGTMFGKTGSWSDTFRLPKFTFFSSYFDTPKHSYFNDYKPSYGQYGQESIFKTYDSPYQNNFINEPSWLYKKDMRAEADFEKWKLKNCLKSSDCSAYEITYIVNRYAQFKVLSHLQSADAQIGEKLKFGRAKPLAF